MEIVSFLGVSHLLKKTKQQSGRDFRRFNSKKRAKTCTGSGLSTAVDGCR